MKKFTQKEYENLFLKLDKFFKEFVWENGHRQTYVSIAEAYKEFDRIFNGKCYGHKFMKEAIEHLGLFISKGYYFQVSANFTEESFVECYLRCYYKAKGYNKFRIWLAMLHHAVFGLQLK